MYYVSSTQFELSNDLKLLGLLLLGFWTVLFILCIPVMYNNLVFDYEVREVGYLGMMDRIIPGNGKYEYK